MEVLASHTSDWFAQQRAREDARDARVKDQLIAKLKDNGVLSEEQMTLFKREVASYGSEQPSLRETRRRQRELDERFDQVHYYTFIDAVIKYIKNHVPNDRCTRVYEDVVSVIPDRSYTPMRGSTPNSASSHENPETPFSVSKAAPGSVKSNAELIDILVSTANLESREAVSIRGHITWFDSINKSTSGMGTPSTGLVIGGRLGRDHTLSDVPNHYVRDRLMNYILTQLDDEDKQEEAKKAVFADLNATELQEYSDIIMQKQREIDEKEQAEWDEARRNYIRRETQRTSEAANRERQDTLINEIDKTIELTPRPGFAIRDYAKVSRIRCSVLKPPIDKPGPHQADGREMEPEERSVEVGEDIDRDCDQVRAMIARFIQDSDWSVDQFRWALGRGRVTRLQLISFLEKKGPSAGKQTHAFPLAWEFFKKRELVGYPMSNTPNDAGVLRERDANRRTKRPSTGEKKNSRGKRTRRI